MSDTETHDSPTDKKLGITLVPNAQSSTSTIGGALAVVFVLICHSNGVDFPAGAEVSIGVLAVSFAGYLHEFLDILIDRLKRR